MIEKLKLEGYEGDGRNPLMDRDIEDKINEIIDYLNCEDQQDLTMEMEIEQAEKKLGKPAEQTDDMKRDSAVKRVEMQQGIIIAQKMKLAVYRSALEKIKSSLPPRFSMEENSEIEATYQKIYELQDIAKTALEGGE